MESSKEFINLDSFDYDKSLNIDDSSSNDIAVIGMAVRFPMADSIEEFWNLLCKGICSVGNIPEGRRDDVIKYRRFKGMDQHHACFEKASYLSEIACFDNNFFQISPKEATLMDPNQRLFLQTAYTAIEDAGYGGNALSGSETGVFVGCSSEMEYRRLVADLDPDNMQMAVTGNLIPVIAGRLAHYLDLHGPNIVIDTVCSSGMVAMHLACQALRGGECTMAIVGGIQLHIIPVREVIVGIESGDGLTRTFDNSSRGTGGGEGITAIVLKPLNDAIRDQDHIEAVIKGSCVNHNGSSIGISSPNPAAQARVLVNAWKRSGIDPLTISYIEAHGTGTPLGDPVEIEGIRQAFARYTNKKQFCAIGSVKTNMGHLDACAGLAGFVKAVLCLKHRKLVPHLHFNNPNRKAELHRSPVYIQHNFCDWNIDNGLRRCGVSSFGFSGTNGHIVLEEAPERILMNKPIENSIRHILPLSAKTKQALLQLVADYIVWLEENPNEDIIAVCYTASAGRVHHEHRLAVLFVDNAELLEYLSILYRNGLHVDNTVAYYGRHRIVSDETRVRSTFDLTNASLAEKNKEILTILDKSKKIGHLSYESAQSCCKLYVSGAQIRWEALFHGMRVGRIALPTYPFEKKRFWLSIPEPAHADDFENRYHFMSWVPAQALERMHNMPQDRFLLIHDNTCGCESITAALQREKMIADTINLFNASGDLNKNAYSEFLTYVNDLFHFNNKLHLLMLCVSDTLTSGNLTRYQENLFRQSAGRLLCLVQSLPRHGQSIDITIILYQQGEVSNVPSSPEGALLYGLGKSVNAECNHCKVRIVDIDLGTPFDVWAGDLTEAEPPFYIMYRNSIRYQEKLMPLPNRNEKADDFCICEGGVYLLAGGLGQMGMAIAEKIAKSHKVTIITVNRTEVPDKEQWITAISQYQDEPMAGIISNLMNWERYGCRTAHYAADIADEKAMGTVIDDISKRFGKINGIFQFAGVGSGQKGVHVLDDTPEQFQQVLRPKVQGTMVLDALTSDKEFMVLVSSPITLTGGAGSGSYAAANSFLNTFARVKRTQGQSVCAVSLAPWNETFTAMSTVYEENKHLFQMLNTEEVYRGLLNAESFDCADWILGYINPSFAFNELKDVLPFLVDKSIENLFTSAGCGNDAVRMAAPIHRISLTGGSESQPFSHIEQIVGNVLGTVLNLDRLDIDDDFFELGGDSIIAMRFLSRLKEEVDTTITIGEVLRSSTVRNIAASIENHIKHSMAKANYIPKAPASEAYPVTSGQKAMFILHYDGETGTEYNMPGVFQWTGNMDLERIRKVYHRLVEYHAVLRTTFELTRHGPVQKVNSPDMAPYIEVIDDKHTLKEAVQSFVRPFILTELPLFRLAVVLLGENEKYLLIDVHHIIADGISMEILVRDFVRFYSRDDIDESREIQFYDYATWLNKEMEADYMKEEQRYWLNELKAPLPVLRLSTDFDRTDIPFFEGNRISFILDKELASTIKKMAKIYETTHFSFLLAGFFILLYKHTAQEDLVVGLPIVVRNNVQTEDMIGLFINNIALRCNISVGDTPKAMVEKVKQRLLKAYDNANYPFDEIVAKLNIPRETGRNPVYDVMFVMHNDKAKRTWKLADAVMTPVDSYHPISKLDLTMNVWDDGNIFHMWLEYKTGLYKIETMETFIAHYIRTVKMMCTAYSNPISQLDLLDQEERFTLLRSMQEISYSQKEKEHPLMEGLKAEFDF